MVRLRMLGEIGLATTDGPEIDALLRQPKSLALLAYLALPRPGTWHRRDMLLATFWPELTQARGRTALRSTLSVLRRHLPEHVIRTRGDEDVSVDPEQLTTDVGEMLDAVDAQRLDSALSRYRGDLLPGLYISGAAEFEQWLGAERARLKAVAVKTAVSRIAERERAGDLVGAADAARRASELDPDDELTMRRWISLLDRTGEHTKAHAVFEQFRSHAATDFGAEPSPQTIALIDALRNRPSASPAPSATAAQAAVAVPTRVSDDAATVPHLAQTVSTPPRWPAARAGWIALAAAAMIVAVLAARTAMRSSMPEVPEAHAVSARAPSASLSSRQLVLLPIRDETSDRSQQYLATGLGYGLTRRLERFGSITIRSGSASEWLASSRRQVDANRELGPTVLLRVTLARVADSLDVKATLLDSASGDERQVMVRRFAATDVREVESQLAASVAGALFRAGVPFAPWPRDSATDPESFRLTTLGYHQMITVRDPSAALQSFVRATELDPSNARAWAGVSTVWGNRTVTTQVDFEVGYERASAAASRALAIDSSQGSALANLGAVRILEYGRLSAGMPLIRRGMAAEPSNPEVFLIASFLSRYGHLWDESRDLIRVARQLDPLTAHYVGTEGSLELCADRPAAAEAVYRQMFALSPSDPRARAGIVRSQARAGRFDEALDSWRNGAGPATSKELVAALANAHGRSGYFALRRLEARRLLADSSAGNRQGVQGRLRLMLLDFQSGDTAAGFANLAAAMEEREPWIYRLPCMMQLDEVRQLPHFKQMLAEIGAMPQR